MRRLPRAVFDYVDGGADAENTLRSNVSIYDQVLFRPRGAVASPRAKLETTVLGQRFSLPFLLAPVGMVAVASTDTEPTLLSAGQLSAAKSTCEHFVAAFGFPTSPGGRWIVRFFRLSPGFENVVAMVRSG